MDEIYKTCPHNPPHLFKPDATYMITGGILYKRNIMDTDEKKAYFCKTLFNLTERFDWQLSAWAVLNNHYHFIGYSPEEADLLKEFIQKLHSLTARFFNQVDAKNGRKVWFNYWDTCITYEKSYLARVHYVNYNPLKHKIVDEIMEYPFCSYRWFKLNADEDLQRKVFSQKYDKVKVYDDF